jgi:hypothetical protein
MLLLGTRNRLAECVSRKVVVIELQQYLVFWYGADIGRPPDCGFNISDSRAHTGHELAEVADGLVLLYFFSFFSSMSRLFFPTCLSTNPTAMRVCCYRTARGHFAPLRLFFS